MVSLNIQYIAVMVVDALQQIKDIAMSVMDIALCQREQEILKWIAEGKTSSEIPLILSISEHTVNFIPEKYAKKVQCT
ncbi:LuxR C-terminal-related transcriptional regulator [Erwinia tracheiphila]|uniref:LuxR C-terminal-related transcriptional regulator n=2 Tax=Erwinia tracheiphila TaxID=65700 RepID=UPI00033B138A|nr:LuxR C-terminal-related transcriptional regulator [Erwinia tracheiphila]EOS96621.1 regulatory protein [Erwinia tracheiphila PSU-1]